MRGHTLLALLQFPFSLYTATPALAATAGSGTIHTINDADAAFDDPEFVPQYTYSDAETSEFNAEFAKTADYAAASDDWTPFSSQDIDTICASAPFELSVDNWIVSGAPSWLDEYTERTKDTEVFRQRGLLASLAREYLGDTQIECGLDTVHRCAPSCSDIVRKMDNPAHDLYDAQVLWLTFAQSQRLAEALRAVHDGLLAAQTNVGQSVAGILGGLYYSGHVDEKGWLRLVGTVLDFSLQMGLSLIPGGTTGLEIGKAAARAAKALRKEAYLVGKFAGEAARQGGAWMRVLATGKRKLNNLKTWTKMVKDPKFHKKVLLAMQPRFIASQVGYMAKNKVVGTLVKPGVGGGSWEADKNSLTGFVRDTSVAARESIRLMAEGLFNSGELDPDSGLHYLVKLLFFGAFLPTGKEGDLAIYHAPDLEAQLTRGLMLKTLSAAFSTQPLYITCTNDHRHTDKTWRASVSAKRDPVADCAHDNVGPADFKACVDGLTCYWYKWDSSSVPMTWHNVRPPGKDTWSLPPLSVSVEDIIASSVRSDQSYAHFQGLSLGDISSPSNFQAAVGLNASLPGMFNIPVCLTPDHSWSTIVDGHHFPMNAYENSIPRNPIKNLPCYCGPWGRDTRRVWKQIPLELDSWENTVGHCGYQLYDRIEDKLERFVASCRLDMHAGMGGLTRFRGRAPECDVVTAIVDRLRLSPAHLKTQMPELYRALLCHTDMLSISERDKCQAYLNRSLKEWEDQAAPRPKKSKPTVDMPEIVKTGRVKSHPTLPPPSFFKTWVPPPKAVPTRRPT